MKNEFALAFNEVIEDKQLPKEIILQALESAMVSAYRRAVNASTAQLVEAKIDSDSGKVSIFAEKEVVDAVQDDRTEVALEEARKIKEDAELGSMVVVECTPHDFGRVAAQTARQVIQQRIRDAERQAQLSHYQKQLGEIVSGLVQAINAQGLTIGLEMRAEGQIARKDMIPGERFRVHDRARALVAEVKDSPRGPQILLSRSHRDFLRRLLENEVPEIYHGVVEIRSIAREPGQRAKVAVSTAQTGIDPVGACVGIRGVRIQAIVRELHDEKIDVIEWNSDPAVFIAKAISPARVVGVYLNDKPGGGKTATVVVPEDQLSLAIGRDGQNARLAAKLTGWRIDIKSLAEAAADAVYKLRNDETLFALAEIEREIIPQIELLLAKKAEGRPLPPEEYDQMAQFVDRVEKRTAVRQEPEKKVVEDTVTEGIRNRINTQLFEQSILDSSLPEHVSIIIQEAGYATVGDLILQMLRQPDDILRLQGIGPKAMNEINKLVESAVPAVPTAPPEGSTEIETKLEPEVETTTLPVAIEVIVEAPQVEVTTPEIEETSLQVAPVTTEVIPEEALTVIAESEEESTFDQLFTLKPEMIDGAEVEVETEEEEDDGTKKDSDKKKKKKKHSNVEIEYDPERDLTTVRKKHKRGDEGWTWEK